MYPIPGLEQGYRRGDAIGLVAGAPVPSGVAICKDLDFVPLGRAHARAEVGLLLVPAWDFENDGWLHSRMAMMRSVEGGYAWPAAPPRAPHGGRRTRPSPRGTRSSEAPRCCWQGACRSALAARSTAVRVIGSRGCALPPDSCPEPPHGKACAAE